MVDVVGAVEGHTEPGAAQAITQEGEALVGRQVEHIDEPAPGERFVLTVRRVDQVTAVVVADRTAHGGYDQPVAGAGPRAERGVLVAAARQVTGSCAVGAYHPHLGPHPSVGGGGARQPGAIGGPGHRAHRVVGDGHESGGGHDIAVEGRDVLDPQLGYAPTVTDERHLLTGGGQSRSPAGPRPNEVLVKLRRHPQVMSLCCSHISSRASCHSALEPSVVRVRFGWASMPSTASGRNNPRVRAAGSLRAALTRSR